MVKVFRSQLLWENQVWELKVINWENEICKSRALMPPPLGLGANCRHEASNVWWKSQVDLLPVLLQDSKGKTALGNPSAPLKSEKLSRYWYQKVRQRFARSQVCQLTRRAKCVFLAWCLLPGRWDKQQAGSAAASAPASGCVIETLPWACTSHDDRGKCRILNIKVFS